MPDRVGHYDYSLLQDPKERISNLQQSRDIIDSFDDYKDVPMHITEFSTSYTPKGVIHDTNLNAAYIAGQLSRLGEMNEEYSYWTFGDVFEEQGVPFSLFHGGFGMVAAGCIPKPTFWSFVFFKDLKDKGRECVHKDDNSVILKTDKGYAGVLWNAGRSDIDMSFILPAAECEYALIEKTVDEDTCNPLKVWHDLGESANPSKETVELIRSAAYPLVTSDILKPEDKGIRYTVTVKKSGVIYFEITKRDFTPDRGYDYERVLNGAYND